MNNEMELDSFIEWMEQADPAMAQLVEDGYCSWEDLGAGNGDDYYDLREDDDYDQ